MSFGFTHGATSIPQGEEYTLTVSTKGVGGCATGFGKFDNVTLALGTSYAATVQNELAGLLGDMVMGTYCVDHGWGTIVVTATLKPGIVPRDSANQSFAVAQVGLRWNYNDAANFKCDVEGVFVSLWNWVAGTDYDSCTPANPFGTEMRVAADGHGLFEMSFVDNGTSGSGASNTNGRTWSAALKLKQVRTAEGAIPSGTLLGLYAPTERRYIQLQPGAVVGSSEPVDLAVIPSKTSDQRFVLVEVSGGVALYSVLRGKYLAPSSADIVTSTTPTAFTKTAIGGGKYKLSTPTCRLAMKAGGDVYCGTTDYNWILVPVFDQIGAAKTGGCGVYKAGTASIVTAAADCTKLGGTMVVPTCTVDCECQLDWCHTDGGIIVKTPATAAKCGTTAPKGAIDTTAAACVAMGGTPKDASNPSATTRCTFSWCPGGFFAAGPNSCGLVGTGAVRAVGTACFAMGGWNPAGNETSVGACQLDWCGSTNPINVGNAPVAPAPVGTGTVGRAPVAPGTPAPRIVK